MMNRPLISVIVPTHNSEKFVRECVSSISNQSYDNLQIICVDSSCDNTIPILRELQMADNRIEIIQDANSSYGYKLNVGIDQARGMYIAIVESDDYILPEMYEMMLQNIEEQDIDYIKCNGTNHFADISDKRIFYPEYNYELDTVLNTVIDLNKNRSWAFYNLPRIWTALYRKDFLVSNKIVANETQGASYQDTSFTQLVALLARKCMYVNGAFYCYRNDNPNSSVKSESKICCVCDEYRHLEKVLCEIGGYSDEIKKHIWKLKVGTYAWNMKRLSEEARDAFREAIAPELEEYTDEVLEYLSEVEKKCYELLVNKEELNKNVVSREFICNQWARILNVAKTEKVVLIGAGIIGQQVLFLQKILGKEIVIVVGDNNVSKEGKTIAGYLVESVENVTKHFSNRKYLIANKRSVREIEIQLQRLEIRKENILYLTGCIELEEFLGECVKQYK